MSTKTKSQKEWTFEDLYNVLMEKIEPELCTYNLDQVDEFYEGEKPKARKKRYEYYAKCLDLFWGGVKDLIEETKIDLNEFEEEFFALLKDKVTGKDESDLTDIEQSISNN